MQMIRFNSENFILYHKTKTKQTREWKDRNKRNTWHECVNQRLTFLMRQIEIKTDVCWLDNCLWQRKREESAYFVNRRNSYLELKTFRIVWRKCCSLGGYFSAGVMYPFWEESTPLDFRIVLKKCQTYVNVAFSYDAVGIYTHLMTIPSHVCKVKQAIYVQWLW